MPSPVLVVDLDGTILDGNSYQFWVRHLLFGRFSHLSTAGRLQVRLSTVAMLAARKLLRWPHARVKGRLREIWIHATRNDIQARDLADLMQQLDARVRQWFSPILAGIADGQFDAILATAAAGEYAIPYARHLGFSHVVATTSDPSLAQENLGSVKVAAVVGLIEARGWSDRPVHVFTDHHDDLPLIALGSDLVWFGAPDALPGIAKSVAVVRAVAAESITAEAVLAQIGARSRETV